MSEDKTAKTTYGYEDDNQGFTAGLQFGLNAGVAFLTKFEFNPNGGKDGAEQEALDIVFTVNEKEVSYRMFPVTKAYDPQGNEITDPKHPKMVEAFRDFNSIVVHILHAFVEKDVIKTAMQVPIKNFKHYCEVAKSVLPKGFETIALDLFAQWQWQITGDNDRTYLRLPKNMKQGKWVCKAVVPVGQWKEKINMGNRYKALFYVDDANNEHPFTRSQWFMESNFAKQQNEEVPVGGDFSPELADEAGDTKEEWLDESTQ